MHIFVVATAVLSLVSTVIASPVPINSTWKSEAAKRGNTDQMVYLVTCNGHPHVSIYIETSLMTPA